MIVLGALVDAQRIVTDWLVPGGIKAKVAMSRLYPVLDSAELVEAQKVFEGKSAEEPCPTCGRFKDCEKCWPLSGGEQ
jgi:hypothetical protein